MLRQLILFLSIISVMTIWQGCGSADIAFMNDVKGFEPKWLELGETVRYIDRNLLITQSRYKNDLAYIEKKAKSYSLGGEYYTMRSQYRSMMKDRDKVQAKFDDGKERFYKTVGEFNKWSTKLMKNKLNNSKAKQAFRNYSKLFQELTVEMDKLQTDVIKNVGKHNSIVKSMSNALNIYTNLNINVR